MTTLGERNIRDFRTKRSPQDSLQETMRRDLNGYRVFRNHTSCLFKQHRIQKIVGMVFSGRQFSGRGGPFAAWYGRAHPFLATRFRLRNHFVHVSQKFRPGGRNVTAVIWYVTTRYFLRENLLSLMKYI